MTGPHESRRPAKRTRSSFEASEFTTTLGGGMDSTTSPHRSGRPTKRARLSYKASGISKTLGCGMDSMTSPQQIHQQDSKKVFPWWNLPGELRNRIYELLVLEDSLLHFSRVARCWAYTVQPVPSQIDEDVEGDVDADRVVKYALKRQKQKGLNTSILYVNSRMYTEAASMLYAQNVFCFQTPGVLYRFITKLSPSARSWIRHIKIVDWFKPLCDWTRALTPAIHSLSTCANLRRFELVKTITIDLWFPMATVAEIFLELPASRKWLHQIGKRSNDPKAGADILCFGDKLLWFRSTGGYIMELTDEETDGTAWDPHRRGTASQEFKRVLGDLLVSAKQCEDVAVAGSIPT